MILNNSERDPCTIKLKVQTNQKIKSAMFSHKKKTIFPPKKMYVPPYYDKISSKSERVVEWGTHDISLVFHHLYRIPKLRTLESPPKLQLFYKGFTK